MPLSILPPFNPKPYILQQLNVFIPVMMVVCFYLVHALYTRKQKRSRQKQNNLDLMRSQIDIQEETFQKISCEIHDNVALTLSLSKIYLHDIDFNDHPDANDKVNLSMCLIKKAMEDLNNLSKLLNADGIQTFGLKKSVEQLVSDISKTELFSITLNIKGTADLPEKDELIVYRMIQEVLNNIIRHAAASEVIMWMDFERTNLRIRICDNGIGFNSNETNDSGCGLKNLKKRAQIINAGLHIESVPHHGTIVKIIVPLQWNHK
jgi:two-component system NarL family sensor kinase